MRDDTDHCDRQPPQGDAESEPGAEAPSADEQ